MNSLGEKILMRRREQGLSQEELAYQVGVSRQTISKWETDSTQPTFDNIKSLCTALKVEVSFFFDDEVCLSETANEPMVNEETTPSVSGEEQSPIVENEEQISSVNEGAPTPTDKEENTIELRIHKRRYLTEIVALSLLVAISAFATFVIGMSLPDYPPNAVVITSNGLSEVHFYIALIITIILLLLDIQLIIFYHKTFSKKSKEKLTNGKKRHEKSSRIK